MPPPYAAHPDCGCVENDIGYDAVGNGHAAGKGQHPTLSKVSFVRKVEVTAGPVKKSSCGRVRFKEKFKRQ